MLTLFQTNLSLVSYTCIEWLYNVTILAYSLILKFYIIVTPQQINLYNNTYTTDIGLSSVECRDTNNVIVNCPFTDGNISRPVFTADSCSNVVKQVRGHHPPSF